MKLALDFPPELVEAVAERVVELLDEREPVAGESWVGVDEAADHLGCPKSRVYSLVSCKPPRIPFEKDGSRLLFKRSELDEWVRRGGAVRP